MDYFNTVSSGWGLFSGVLCVEKQIKIGNNLSNLYSVAALLVFLKVNQKNIYLMWITL